MVVITIPFDEHKLKYIVLDASKDEAIKSMNRDTKCHLKAYVECKTKYNKKERRFDAVCINERTFFLEAAVVSDDPNAREIMIKEVCPLCKRIAKCSIDDFSYVDIYKFALGMDYGADCPAFQWRENDKDLDI